MGVWMYGRMGVWMYGHMGGSSDLWIIVTVMPLSLQCRGRGDHSALDGNGRGPLQVAARACRGSEGGKHGGYQESRLLYGPVAAVLQHVLQQTVPGHSQDQGPASHQHCAQVLSTYCTFYMYMYIMYMYTHRCTVHCVCTCTCIYMYM